jgi:hypothetical protein
VASSLLSGLRRAVATVLRVGPCVSPGGKDKHAVAIGNSAPDVDSGGGAARALDLRVHDNWPMDLVRRTRLRL